MNPIQEIIKQKKKQFQILYYKHLLNILGYQTKRLKMDVQKEDQTYY